MVAQTTFLTYDHISQRWTYKNGLRVKDLRKSNLFYVKATRLSSRIRNSVMNSRINQWSQPAVHRRREKNSNKEIRMPWERETSTKKKKCLANFRKSSERWTRACETEKKKTPAAILYNPFDNHFYIIIRACFSFSIESFVYYLMLLMIAEWMIVRDAGVPGKSSGP